jgi:hypothetical protein
MTVSIFPRLWMRAEAAKRRKDGKKRAVALKTVYADW